MYKLFETSPCLLKNCTYPIDNCHRITQTSTYADPIEITLNTMVDNRLSRQNAIDRSDSLTDLSLLQDDKPPPSLTNSPKNRPTSSTRSRQLWNLAIDGVRNHENVSSTTEQKPIGWYNLAKR
ncbi:unnamed protein product, partial [Adineta ricciae]